ncbi:MAG TPA: hypothetical protein VE869_02410 [Gemmatimonas sp.]|nr:hypothetical protein [Gemmatimonas sp.]
MLTEVFCRTATGLGRVFRCRRAGLGVAMATCIATGIAACSAGVPSVSTDISTRQAMLDLGQNLVDVREENAALQAQVDSLRGAVAYQDTVLRQLAGLAGVPVRPPAFVVP